MLGSIDISQEAPSRALTNLIFSRSISQRPRHPHNSSRQHRNSSGQYTSKYCISILTSKSPPQPSPPTTGRSRPP
ncbi:hypothetical protein WAI453_011180 [Rhynchosporium graminicola]